MVYQNATATSWRRLGWLQILDVTQRGPKLVSTRWWTQLEWWTIQTTNIKPLKVWMLSHFLFCFLPRIEIHCWTNSIWNPISNHCEPYTIIYFLFERINHIFSLSKSQKKIQMQNWLDHRQFLASLDTVVREQPKAARNGILNSGTISFPIHS